MQTRKLLWNVLTLMALVVMCVVGSASAMAQGSSKVKGRIVDQNGEPIIGAAVVVAGTSTGTVTDYDGNFEINAPKNASLQVACLGYNSVTEPINGRTVLNFTLQDEFAELEEIQVVAYGAQKKVTVTGSVASVDGAELAKTPVGSVSNMLTGQLAGLTTVQYSGEPGADAATIFVRGQATWEDASPLVLVDGVERDFNTLDPNEIADLTILKDAAATAVFGVRGANGVVLVTTKRGSEGKAKISVSTSYTMVQPSKPVEMARSVDYITFHRKLNEYDHMYDTPGADDSWVDANGTMDQSRFIFSQSILDKFVKHEDPIFYPDIDWVDYVFKKHSLQTQHNLSVSGGSKQARYFVSVGFYTKDGLFKNFDMPYKATYDYKRFNYRTNLDIDVTPTSTISIGIGGNHNVNYRPYSGQASSAFFASLYGATPFSSAGFVDGKLVTSSDDYLDAEVQLPFVGGNGLGHYNVGIMSDTNNTLNADLQFSQKLDFLTKGLKFHVKGSYNSGFTSYLRAQYGGKGYTPRTYDENGNVVYRMYGAKQQLSYQNVAPGKTRNWRFEAAVNYDRTFAEAHHVTLLALYQQEKKYYPKTFGEIPTGYVGFSGRATYDYKSRYMAEFNLGINGSENFAPDKRFGKFPAGSVGWNISQEDFWGDIKDYVSYFKLRYTIGQVGNDKIGGGARFMYTPDPYEINNNTDPNRGGFVAIFGDDNGIGTRHMGTREKSKNNPNVTWEKATKQNFGVDLHFLNDEIKLSYDYYVEHRKDILLKDGVAPSTLGFDTPYSNLGEVDAWGWEFSVKWNKRLNDDWLVNAGLNVMFNDNKIIERREAPKDYDYQYTKGTRLNRSNLLQFFELYEPGKTEERYKAKYGEDMPSQFQSLLPGDLVYVDLNHDGKVDKNDYSYKLSKTEDPRHSAGFNAGFVWKGLSFSMNWAASWEVSRIIDAGFRAPFWDKNYSGKGGLVMYHVRESFDEAKQNYNAKYPRPTFDRLQQNYQENSTFWEKDSKYLRLKSVQLAYDFKFPFMETVKMTNMQLSLSAYNLLTFTPYIWGDPENRASAAPSYPLDRTYTVALKMGF